MSTDHNLFRSFASCVMLSFALTALAGCVGPMACPPGCDTGPIGMGCGGAGCGDCNSCGELYIDPWINHPADTCDPCDVCGNHNGQSCGKCRSVFDGARSMWGYRCGSDCGSCDETACDAGPCPYPDLGIMRAIAGFTRAVVYCGTCGQVDCGCDSFVEPVFANGCDTCGEATCGCDVGCDTCGEATCGCDVGCGVCGEVACGCESGGMYANETFNGGHYAGAQPTPIQDEVVEYAPAEKPYKPSRTRKIFQQRPDVAETPQASNY